MKNKSTPLESMSQWRPMDTMRLRIDRSFISAFFPPFFKRNVSNRIGSAQFWLGYFAFVSTVFLESWWQCLRRRNSSRNMRDRVGLALSCSAASRDISISQHSQRVCLSSVTASLFRSLNNFSLDEKVSIVPSSFLNKTNLKKF